MIGARNLQVQQRVQEMAQEKGDQDAMDFTSPYHPEFGAFISVFNEGSFFGEEALLGADITRETSVVAVAECKVWMLDSATVNELSRESDVKLFYQELESFAKQRQKDARKVERRAKVLDTRLEQISAGAPLLHPTACHCARAS